MSEMTLQTVGIDPLVPTGNNVIESQGVKAINPNTPPPWGGAVTVEIVATHYREATGSAEGPSGTELELAAFDAAAAAVLDSWTPITPYSELDATVDLIASELISEDPDIYRLTARVRDNKWICRFSPPHTSRMKIRMTVNGADVDIEWNGAEGIDLGGVPTIFPRAPGQDPLEDIDWIYDPAGERIHKGWSRVSEELPAPLVTFSSPLRDDPAAPF